MPAEWLVVLVPAYGFLCFLLGLFTGKVIIPALVDLWHGR